MKLIFVFLKGVVLGATPFLLSFSFSGASADDKDVATRAQELSLRRERIKASELLVHELQKETSFGSKKSKELLKALSQHSEIFYTEAAQQKFEQAQSMAFSQLAGAAEVFGEALELEPHNLSLLLAIVRFHLSEQRCDRANEFANKALAVNPFSSELYILRMRTKACEGSLDEASLKDPPWITKEVLVYHNLLKGEMSFQLNKLDEAKTHFQASLNEDENFGETYYWLWEVSKKLETPDYERAHKYVSICKNLTSRVRRKYWLQPDLCSRATTVEKEAEKAK